VIRVLGNKLMNMLWIFKTKYGGHIYRVHIYFSSRIYGNPKRYIIVKIGVHSLKKTQSVYIPTGENNKKKN
jgi:hypothetical protein